MSGGQGLVIQQTWGADPGFFSRGGPPLRNGVTDW